MFLVVKATFDDGRRNCRPARLVLRGGGHAAHATPGAARCRNDGARAYRPPALRVQERCGFAAAATAGLTTERKMKRIALIAAASAVLAACAALEGDNHDMTFFVTSTGKG